jgi:hypothetical protein
LSKATATSRASYDFTGFPRAVSLDMMFLPKRALYCEASKAQPFSRYNDDDNDDDDKNNTINNDVRAMNTSVTTS